MQRWLSIVLGLAAVGLVIAVVVRGGDKAAEPKAVVADAAPRDAGKPLDAAPATVAASDASIPDPSHESPGLARFPDGRPVPPLPEGAPKRVRLGVVLVTLAGAQGAPPNARDAKEALAIATKLANDAKTDFHGAVVRGDSGSSDDIGHVPRGILEPPTEYTVFTMAVGAVSDPIETPRGYWIAKRTE